MLAIDPRGKRLATACDDGTTTMWDAETGSQQWTTDGGMQTDSHSNFRNKRGLAFSPNGKLLAVDGSDNSIILYDSTGGKELFRLKGHDNQIRCLAFSRCGEFLASGSGDHTVRLWSIKSRKELWRTVSGHSSRTRGIAFGPDGKRLITGGGGWGNPSSVRLRLLGDDAEGQETFTLPFEFNDPIWCLAVSGDGRWIAAGGSVTPLDRVAGSAIKLWDGRPLTAEVRIEREAVALIHWLEAQGLATGTMRERIRGMDSLYHPVRLKAIELLELY
jgi:WD40 repeat protein